MWLFAFRSSQDSPWRHRAISSANGEKRLPTCILIDSASSCVHAPARKNSRSRGKETAVHQQLLRLRPCQRSRTPAEVCARQETRALPLPLSPATALCRAPGPCPRRHHRHHPRRSHGQGKQVAQSDCPDESDGSHLPEAGTAVQTSHCRRMGGARPRPRTLPGRGDSQSRRRGAGEQYVEVHRGRCASHVRQVSEEEAQRRDLARTARHAALEAAEKSEVPVVRTFGSAFHGTGLRGASAQSKMKGWARYRIAPLLGS